jgi:hypothetical protein
MAGSDDFLKTSELMPTQRGLFCLRPTPEAYSDQGGLCAKRLQFDPLSINAVNVLDPRQSIARWSAHFRALY